MSLGEGSYKVEVGFLSKHMENFLEKVNGKFHRKQREVYTAKRCFLEGTWGNSWKSVEGMRRKQKEELLESIWVVGIRGKQVGNWEAAKEFPRKHKVNFQKVGTEFLESRGGFPRKHMGETTAEQIS